MLSEYRGTILLVSHDRYLIDALATQIWEVLPEEKTLRQFFGTFSEYRAELTAETVVTAPQKKEAAHTAAETRKGLSPWKRQQLIQKVEERIAGIESQMALVSGKLANPPSDPAAVQHLGSEYVRLEKDHAELMDEWSLLMEE